MGDIKNKNKWYMTLIGYYMLILLIPFSVIMVLCFSGTQLVRSEAIKANQIVVEQLRQEIDSKIADLRKINAYIQSDAEFLNFSNSQDELDSTQRYRIVKMNEKFSSLMLTEELIDNYLIYIPDRVMMNNNSYRSASETTDEAFGEFFVPIPDYKHLFTKKYQAELLPVYKKNTEEVEHILFMDSMNSPLLKNKSVQFVIQLDIAELGNLINEVTAYDESIFFSIIDKSGNLPIYVNNHNLYQRLQEKKLEGYQNNRYLSIESNHDYYCYRVSSKTTNLDYALLMPSQHIVNATRGLSYIIIGCIFLVLLSAVLIFRLIRMREYHSIATTIALLDEDITNEKSSSVFGHVQKTVSKLLLDKKALEESLVSSEAYLQKYFLFRLLTQEIDNRQGYLDLLEEYKITFPYSRFRVLLFNCLPQTGGRDLIAKYDNFIETEGQEIIGEMKDDFIVYSLQQNGMMIIILNYDIMLMENNLLLSRMESFQKKLQKNDMISALSSWKDSCFELKYAYDEAMEALEWCLVENAAFKEYRTYSVDQQLNSKHSKYYQYEMNFRNALAEGNYKNAEILADNMFVLVRNSFSDNTAVIKCKLFGILNILLGEISKYYENTVYLDFLYQQISGDKTIKELKEAIINILHYMIDCSRQIDKEDFSAQVEQYVGQNFCSVSLSVGMIAGAFEVDLPTLSKRFKKERGMNISDYIHITRLQKAKELLKSNRWTIKAIAEQCGYVNSDVFIRVFKRYEGITPGKYRDGLSTEKA